MARKHAVNSGSDTAIHVIFPPSNFGGGRRRGIDIPVTVLRRLRLAYAPAVELPMKHQMRRLDMTRTSRFFGINLVLFLAIILLAACSSGGGSSTQTGGEWRGTWSSASGVGGSIVALLTQNGQSLTGTVTIGNTLCLSNGTVTGTADDDGATFGAVDGTHRITFTAPHFEPDRMAGTYSVDAGLCAGDFGDFDISRVSGR